jgi:hypothetical protein
MDLFYREVGLDTTSNSHQVGWTTDRAMELEYSSVLTPDGKPALAFDYSYVKSL